MATLIITKFAFTEILIAKFEAPYQLQTNAIAPNNFFKRADYHHWSEVFFLLCREIQLSDM